MADKVYYDESCYVCSLEINTIRSRGEACGIEFIDISADDFDGNVEDFEQEVELWMLRVFCKAIVVMIASFNNKPI